MKFTYIEDGIDCVIVDDFYTKKQLKDITLELDAITRPEIFKVNQEQLDSYVDDNGNKMSSRSGIFLEQLFSDWRHSAIMSHGVTQTSTQEFQSKLLEFNTMFRGLFSCNARTHLVSYYENSDYYKPHVDVCSFTLMSYFHTTPKQYTGGELVLQSCNSNKEVELEPENNQAVLILSNTMHEVRPIISDLENTFSGHGRYCVASFLSLIDNYITDELGLEKINK